MLSSLPIRAHKINRLPDASAEELLVHVAYSRVELQVFYCQIKVPAGQRQRMLCFLSCSIFCVEGDRKWMVLPYKIAIKNEQYLFLINYVYLCCKLHVLCLSNTTAMLSIYIEIQVKETNVEY